eukprot:jgi/Ulvmu1/4268/UM194_0008.1
MKKLPFKSCWLSQPSLRAAARAAMLLLQLVAPGLAQMVTAASTVQSEQANGPAPLSSRALLQTDVDAAAPSPTQPQLPTVAAAAVSVVTTAAELQAVAVAAAQDIELQSHLDLRSLRRITNPDLPRETTEEGVLDYALLYVHGGMRSMRGNCSDPDAATALALAAEEAAALLPLKPRQCLVIVPDNMLVINGGDFWLDNVYLRLARTQFLPDFAFVTVGLPLNRDVPQITAGRVAATNVTVQSEQRGCAEGFAVISEDSSVLLQDCMFTDWRGGASPLRVSRSVANIVDTVFRNTHLPVELIDVSFNGVVRFERAALADVTLSRGDIVSTTFNDYYLDPVNDVYYYAYDDSAYDVAATEAPIDRRGEFGAEFVVDEAVMSDCVYLKADDGVVQPGCPEVSAEHRRVMLRRGSRGGLAQDLDPAGESAAVRLAKNLVAADSPWLLALRAALRELPAAPQGWPEFDVAPEGDPVDPVPLGASLPAVPGTVVPSFERTTAAAREGGAAAADLRAAYTGVIPEEEAGPSSGVLVAVAAVGLAALIAAVAAAWAALVLRRMRKTQERLEGRLLSRPRRPRLPSWMSGGADSLTESNATNITPVGSNRASSRMPRTGSSASGHAQSSSSGSMPQSAMNPNFEYALPTHIARLMGGGIMETEDEAEGEAAKGNGDGYEKKGGAAGGGDGGGPTPRSAPWMLQLASLPATQPSGVPSERGLAVTDGGAGSGAGGGSLLGSNTAPLAGSSAVRVRQESLDAHTEGPGSTVIVAPYDLAQNGSGVWTTEGGGTRVHTVGGTIPTSTSGGEWRSTRSMGSTGSTPPSTAGPSSAGTGMRRRRVSSLEGGSEERGGGAGLAPSMDVGQSATDVSLSDARIRRLQRLLDAFGEEDLFLGRFEMLGRQQRRRGGQAIVQFAEGAADHCDYAIKFFLDYESFLTEAALYAACFPHVRAEVSDDVLARADAAAGIGGNGGAEVPMSEVAARFLPQVDAVCDGSAGGLEDPRGRWLPPCIVMEKGESLHDWSDRAQPDLFTSLAVLSNVSKRLADMHAAGYVHRDLKPANVMWLPRANRWTIIDFGCVARIGEVAPLNFTLAYAPPEVARAFTGEHRRIESNPALDAWSLGVMAFELLTGAPAFNLLTDGRSGVMARLRGDLPLPWEGVLSTAVLRHLGSFRGPILQLLHREPSQRISMRQFHIACSKLFAARTTVEA